MADRNPYKKMLGCKEIYSQSQILRICSDLFALEKFRDAALAAFAADSMLPMNVLLNLDNSPNVWSRVSDQIFSIEYRGDTYCYKLSPYTADCLTILHSSDQINNRKKLFVGISDNKNRLRKEKYTRLLRRWSRMIGIASEDHLAIQLAKPAWALKNLRCEDLLFWASPQPLTAISAYICENVRAPFVDLPGPLSLAYKLQRAIAIEHDLDDKSI